MKNPVKLFYHNRLKPKPIPTTLVKDPIIQLREIHPELVRIGKDIVVGKNLQEGKLMDYDKNNPVAVFKLKDGTNVSVSFTREKKYIHSPDVLIRKKDEQHWKRLRDTGEVVEI
jgi:hypothetical protein